MKFSACGDYVKEGWTRDARIHQHCIPVISAGDGCGEVGRNFLERIDVDQKPLSDWLISRMK